MTSINMASRYNDVDWWAVIATVSFYCGLLQQYKCKYRKPQFNF